MFWFIYILVFLIGLVQTPIMVDLLRLLYPEWRIKRLTSQLASTLLIILMSVFAVIGLGLQIFYFIPLVPDVPFRTTKVICHSIFAYWIWINMVVNYYYAIFIEPGKADSEDADNIPAVRLLNCTKVTEERSDYNCWEKVTSNDNNSDDPQVCSEMSSGRRLNNDGAKQVTHTSLTSNKADQDSGASKLDVCLGTSNRSHYCKVCQVTVLYKDHHCPFTGNCVGLNNYAYFLSALCYASIGLGYSLVVGCLYFGECVFPTIWTWLQINSSVREGTCSIGEPYTELFLPALGGFFVLNIILLFQMFILLSDLTTYEVLKNFWKVPVLKVGYERIRNKKYMDKESRLNVLLLSRRTSFVWFLFPVRNINIMDNCM